MLCKLHYTLPSQREFGPPVKKSEIKKKIVYSVAVVFIYSVGWKHFCYYKRPLQSSFLINDQILQTSCFLFLGLLNFVTWKVYPTVHLNGDSLRQFIWIRLISWNKIRWIMLVRFTQLWQWILSLLEVHFTLKFLYKENLVGLNTICRTDVLLRTRKNF